MFLDEHKHAYQVYSSSWVINMYFCLKILDESGGDHY